MQQVLIYYEGVNKCAIKNKKQYNRYISNYNFTAKFYNMAIDIDWNFNKCFVFGYAVYLSLAFSHFGFFNVQYTIRNDIYQEEKNSNIVAIVGFLGGVVGSLLDSIIVKFGKRARFIFGNFIILLFSFPLYFKEPRFLVAISSFMYGVGIGLNTSIAPFYMKEVIPESILPLALASLQFFMILANEIGFSLSYVMTEHPKTKNTLLTIIAFLIPGILAIIQITFGFAVFNRDTPLKLCCEAAEDESLMELQRIYPDTDRRLSEFEKLRKRMAMIRSQYPSYGELFSEKYIESTRKGFILVLFANGVGVFFGLVFTFQIYTNLHAFKGTNLVLTGFKLVSTFFLYAVIHPKGKKMLLLVGSIGVTLTNYGNFILRLVYNDTTIKNLPIGAVVNMGIGFVFDGFSTCYMPILYACQIMTERGFALAMFIYWFSYQAIAISFASLIEKFRSSAYTCLLYTSDAADE
eukprot:TRINITY_DN1669_c0_g1_i14.p1 TRINITY_DN1669_c0_g1~~TRINITY_DN1669_c0_g1_i14.p1  ORF type:complete len:463 (+),score=65.00 TRINITY_DN1669_c0_g1_i14:16-1404(+)